MSMMERGGTVPVSIKKVGILVQASYHDSMSRTKAVFGSWHGHAYVVLLDKA